VLRERGCAAGPDSRARDPLADGEAEEEEMDERPKVMKVRKGGSAIQTLHRLRAACSEAHQTQ
jgi:hypothetical protein